MYGYYYTMSFRIMNSFRHFISAIFLSSIVSAAHAGDLVVLVENVKSDRGTVRVAIFNNAKKFNIFNNAKELPKTWLAGQAVAAKVGTVSFTFKNLQSGQYAVCAFQDMNGNETLDKNFVGWPVEPYGFSRDAKGLIGPPAFEDASFQVDDGAKTIIINLK